MSGWVRLMYGCAGEPLPPTERYSIMIDHNYSHKNPCPLFVSLLGWKKRRIGTIKKAGFQSGKYGGSLIIERSQKKLKQLFKARF